MNSKIMRYWGFFFLTMIAHSTFLGRPNQLVHNKFSNVLLIINFNHPYYGNIDFIKRLYSPFFPHIIFYGEKPDPRVTALPTSIGYYISDLLTDAITKYPGYDGYLFLEDDCVLNMWNCFELDINKVWILPNFNRTVSATDYHVDFFTANVITGYDKTKWGWWFPHNYEAGKKAYEKLSSKDKAILEHNIGSKNICSTSADMFYFPAKYSDQMLRLVAYFKDVFIEVAVPTMLACLDYKENWEKVTIIWGLPDSYVQQNWPKSFTCVHPLKLSSVTNQTVIKRIFESMIPEITI